MNTFCISAVASHQGKTILTTALLWYFRGSVRPFKVGPDFIDPQFHERVCGTPSVNLDTYIMTDEQMRWLFDHYADRKYAVIEGVMGYYDGEDRGCSAYSVSRELGVPTILLLDGSGSYITLSAVLKGMLDYRDDHTIRAVVLNRLSSPSHYALIKKQIEADHPDITVLGWIPRDLPSLRDTHLGLDLEELDTIATISREVLEHIDTTALKTLTIHHPPSTIHHQPSTIDYRPSTIDHSSSTIHHRLSTIDHRPSTIDHSSSIIQHPTSTIHHPYPFPPIPTIDKTLAVVHDRNFSFLYHDNLMFLQEVFREVVLVDATRDEPVPEHCDALYLPGGYVETDEAYSRIQNAQRFRRSLTAHARTRPVYAECAGLLYLGNRVDDKPMAAVLDLDFTLERRFVRLGYYQNGSGVRGHAFHYTRPTEATLAKGFDPLRKHPDRPGEAGSWQTGRVRGTYLHTFFRAYPQILDHFKELS